MPTTLPPPLPVSELLAVTPTVIVYWLELIRLCIWYSWFKTVAVTKPPKVAAPEKVTKSFKFAPCAESVTVTVEEPFVAEKVTSPEPVVALTGVISLKVEPSSI